MLEAPERFNALLADELEGKLGQEPFALPRGEPGTRAAVCDGGRGQVFTGDFGELTLNKCADVQITSARIGRLTLRDSSVRIVNSHIYDGLEARNSRVEITAGLIGGNPPLVLEVSDVDAAARVSRPRDLSPTTAGAPTSPAVAVGGRRSAPQAAPRAPCIASSGSRPTARW
jgi:hypothetical protein